MVQSKYRLGTITEEELQAVIRLGAERLMLIPVAQQERALVELKAAAEKIARGLGYSPDEWSRFAGEVMDALKAAATSDLATADV